MKDLYFRHACLDRVIDGDTIDLTIDLGYRVTRHVRVRLAGVNTPELRGPDKPKGIESKAFVQGWLDQSVINHPDLEYPLIVASTKTGKYGRWLADIHPPTGDGSLVEDIIANGYGTPYTP